MAEASSHAIALDPKTTALVLIDLQNGIVGRATEPRPAKTVVENAVKLLAKFREAGATVVLVHVGFGPDRKEALRPQADEPAMLPPPDTPATWMDLVTDLAQQPGDVEILKRQWGAFHGTELDLQLRRRGVRTIVLAGIATNLGVESTARDAYEHGYEQIFVEDAMASFKAEAHAFAVKSIFPRIGRVRTTDQVLQAFAG